MASVNGRQRSQLSDALRDAFLPAALDELLYFGLDVRREDLTLADDYRTRVFHIIRKADSEGWLFDLVVAAREARPRKAALQAIAAELGLSTAPGSLERIVRESVPFVDVSDWRARLGVLENQVCRVEVHDGRRASLGTGFLVGHDLCLTNYHVVRQLIEGSADPTQTRLRFDYRRAADGTVTNEGTLFPLARDWLIAARPPSPADHLADGPGSLPSAEELDFAVLRVQDALGDARVGRASRVDDSPSRGWLDQLASDGYEAGSPLFLLQHPQGAPLKLSFGQSLGLNANATRLRHLVNTEPGSSGSPCLNARLELVGLHHAGDPNFDPAHKPAYNSVIPIRAILDCLSKDSIAVDLFPPGQ